MLEFLSDPPLVVAELDFGISMSLAFLLCFSTVVSTVVLFCGFLLLSPGPSWSQKSEAKTSEEEEKTKDLHLLPLVPHWLSPRSVSKFLYHENE